MVQRKIPAQLMGFPLHCPECKHVLVTFPLALTYPLWQPNVHIAPYKFPQEVLKSMAFWGTSTGPQLWAFKIVKKNALNNIILKVYDISYSDMKSFLDLEDREAECASEAPNPPNLATFPEIYLVTCWRQCHVFGVSISLWQLQFKQIHVFWLR